MLFLAGAGIFCSSLLDTDWLWGPASSYPIGTGG